MQYRYNCQVIKVENAGEETPKNYITRAELDRLIDDMTDGDELTIQTVEYTGGI